MTKEEFEALYQEKHDESVYIVLTNLAKVRMANQILRDTLLLDNDPFITEEERAKIITKLTIWQDKMSAAMTGDEDHLLGDDDEPLEYHDAD